MKASMQDEEDTVVDLHDPLLTSTQIAADLAMPVKRIYANKHLMPILRVGRDLRFRASEVDAWLEQHRDSHSFDLRAG